MSEQHAEQRENRQDFGGRLAALRRAAGLSQQQLAEQLFVTRQAVSRWEGNRTQPDLATLQQLTAVLGCSLDELVGGLDPDAAFRRRCASWQKTTRLAFWLALAVQLGLFVLGAVRGTMEWVLLPVLLFLCGGSLHPMLAVMISSGDYTMLAGYDPDAAYDRKKLETLVRAMDLWVQLANLGISLMAVPVGFAASGAGFVVLIISQVVGLLGDVFSINMAGIWSPDIPGLGKRARQGGRRRVTSRPSRQSRRFGGADCLGRNSFCVCSAWGYFAFPTTVRALWRRWPPCCPVSAWASPFCCARRAGPNEWRPRSKNGK